MAAVVAHEVDAERRVEARGREWQGPRKERLHAVDVNGRTYCGCGASFCMKLEKRSGREPRRTVRNMVEAAIARQTNRVFALGTVTRGTLTTLVEADFGEADGSAAGLEEVPEVLAKLDNVVGLDGSSVGSWSCAQVAPESPWKMLELCQDCPPSML